MNTRGSKVEARSFSIALLGVSSIHCKILQRIAAVTQCRKRKYYLVNSCQGIVHADIVMVNVENTDAVMKWRDLREKYKGNNFKTAIEVHSIARGSDSVAYSVCAPFNPSRLIKMLDKYTIKELDYIPELSIDEHDGRDIESNTVYSLVEFINEKKPTQPSKKVLVVDDSEVVRHQLGLELKMKNFEATYAESGEEALTLLKMKKYDLLFLDVMLPGVDGYTVCKHIKRNPLLKSMPVIMLTSRTSRFDKLKGTLAGCDTYATKPVNHQEFNRIAKKYLPC
jgi:CheY-like chemotaxis protein